MTLSPAIGFRHPETVPHVIGVVSPACTRYLGYEFFSFGMAAQ